jgi:hypothetical protein
MTSMSERGFSADDLAGLEPTESGGNVELIDPATGEWMMRFERVHLDHAVETSTGSATAAVVARSFTEALPGLAQMFRASMSHAPGTVQQTAEVGYRVVFSPSVQKGINSGSLRMMQSARGTLPTAINNSGKIVQTAAVVAPDAVAATAGAAAVSGAAVAGGAAAAGGVAATATIASVAIAALPIVLVVGAGIAASMAHQRWLEQTFGQLQGSLDRLETRLRDDDLGTLESADRLMDMLAEDLSGGSIPEQLKLELAAVQARIDALYWSRRRYVERYKRQLEERQTAHEVKTGKTSAWAGRTAEQIVDEDQGVIDELVVFTQAMITRARVTAATAAVLAADGEAAAAIRRIDELDTTMRRDYFDLYNRVTALASNAPEMNRWKQLIDRGTTQTAIERVAVLAGAMDQAIGSALPDRDEAGVLPVFAASELEDLFVQDL